MSNITLEGEAKEEFRDMLWDIYHTPIMTEDDMDITVRELLEIINENERDSYVIKTYHI